MDAVSERGPSGYELATWFTDSVRFFGVRAGSLAPGPGMEKKWSAGHSDRYGTGELAPAISAVPWATPETPAGPIAGGRTVGARYRAL